jgi:hypothetical protein
VRRGATIIGLAAALAGCGLDLTGDLATDAGGDDAGAPSDAAPPPSEAGSPDASVDDVSVAETGAPDTNVAPRISWTVTPDPGDIDLTQAGAIDWAHWGDTVDGAPVHKATGGGVIGSFSVTGATCNDNMGPSWPVNASWNDGTPVAVSAPTNLHRRFYGTNGLTVSFSVPCDGTTRVFTVDVGGWASEARFEADFDTVRVSPAIMDTRGSTADYYAARYAVTFVCPVSMRLVVRWIATNLPAPIGCSGSDMILSSATLR